MDDGVAGDERVILLAGNERELAGLLPVRSGQVLSRRVLKAPGVGIVRIALDAGETLAEHEARVPVLIQVISGTVRVDAAGRVMRMSAGAVLYIASRVRHAVSAEEQAHLMLTLAEGAGERRRSRAAAASMSPPVSSDAPASPSPDGSLDVAMRAPITGHLVLASSGADSLALAAITRLHAEISGALAAHSSWILDAAATGSRQRVLSARDAFSEWSRSALTAVLAAEAAVLYPAADETPEGVELVHLLRESLDRIGELLHHARTETDPVSLAGSTVAVRVAVEHHLTTETERLLPLLALSSGRSLAELWAQVARVVPSPREPLVPTAAAVCACGTLEEQTISELDAPGVPDGSATPDRC